MKSLPASIAFAALVAIPISAKVEYRVNHPDATLFRDASMTPPPLSTLDNGEKVELIRRGSSVSEVRTSEGRQGWISNKDLIAMTVSDPQQHQLGEQVVTGLLEPGLIVILGNTPSNPEIFGPERNFGSDVVEFADREQVETRNSEN